jgi:hypothetical protein
VTTEAAKKSPIQYLMESAGGRKGMAKARRALINESWLRFLQRRPMFTAPYGKERKDNPRDVNQLDRCAVWDESLAAKVKQMQAAREYSYRSPGKADRKMMARARWVAHHKASSARRREARAIAEALVFCARQIMEYGGENPEVL